MIDRIKPADMFDPLSGKLKESFIGMAVRIITKDIRDQILQQIQGNVFTTERFKGTGINGAINLKKDFITFVNHYTQNFAFKLLNDNARYYTVSNFREYKVVLYVIPNINTYDIINSYMLMGVQGKPQLDIVSNKNYKKLLSNKSYYSNYYGDMLYFQYKFLARIDFLYKTIKGVYEPILPMTLQYDCERNGVSLSTFDSRVKEFQNIKFEWGTDYNSYILPFTQKEHELINWLLLLTDNLNNPDKKDRTDETTNLSFESGFDKYVEESLIKEIKSAKKFSNG